MSSRGNLSLPELAARYHIADLFGASVAYFSSAEGGESNLRAFTNRISCYEVQLIREGSAYVKIGENQITLHSGDLLALTPFQPVECIFPKDIVTEGLLIESQFYENILSSGFDHDISMRNIPSKTTFVYHLDEARTAELSGIFQQIRKAIHYVHIYKAEIIRSLVHVCLMYISELPYDTSLITRDFRHKEKILKIFLYLASKNFKTQRQIQFYADKLNITTTYLSRVMRELSGSTVNNHLTMLTYEEACNLLKTTDMTVGEISDELGFRDQSAFTNFFKLHAACSPKAYRDK